MQYFKPTDKHALNPRQSYRNAAKEAYPKTRSYSKWKPNKLSVRECLSLFDRSSFLPELRA